MTMRTADEYREECRRRGFFPTVEELKPKRRTAELSIHDGSDLTFSQLLTVSEVFGTKSIAVSAEAHDDGFCVHTQSPKTSITIRVEDITR